MSDADYLQIYDEFWKRIVENEDGTLNKDQVARELADCKIYMDHLTEIYCWASGDAVSKPNTLPSVVIGLAEERLMPRDQVLVVGDQTFGTGLDSWDF